MMVSLVLVEFSGGFGCSKFGKCLWVLAVVTAMLLGEFTKFQVVYEKGECLTG